MIQQALDYAQKNPESQYATELRRRIESGAMDKELAQSGLEYKQGVGITKKQKTQVIDALGSIAGVENIGKGIGQALVNPEISKNLEKTQEQGIDIQTNLLKTIKEKKSKGEDTSRLEAALQDVGGNIEQLGEKTGELLNQEDISGKKILGDVIQIGSYMFPFGKVAGAAGKVIGKTGGKIASGTTGGYIADIGFNLQNDKDGSDIFKPGAATIIGGAFPIVGAAIGAAAKGTKKIVDTEKTIGNILQSKSNQAKNASLAQKALSEIDTSGVKTFDELSQKLDEGMKTQMNKVDEAFAKDTKQYTLDDFTVRTKDTAGNEIKTDIIGEALKNLDELYVVTADNTASQNIKLLAQKAVEEGLTRQEVNNIARLYSEEFGTKGFNKIGDALTSVNAQKFQNIQRGLKESARGGTVLGEEAKAADQAYSAMRNTKALIDKNRDSVQSLRQKIQERGVIEKLTRGTIRALDVLSGGTLRGAVGAVFPSNIGLKTLNYLDIEKNIAKNLKLLEEAGNITEPNKLIKFLNEKIGKIKFPGDSVVDSIKK